MSAIEPVELDRVHLSPGEILISREPAMAVTVLGSCVAVTMFHRKSLLSAICHIMLAEPRAGECLRSDDPVRFRYASYAVPAMIASYRRAGIELRSVEIKVFGGANVIGHAAPARDASGIGEVNVAAVRALLDESHLRLTAEHTGGHHGRKIMFNTGTGEVLLKRLARN